MKHGRVCLGGLCLLGLALAWHNRFIQDDAFISFTYAKHLVAGHGLTWFGTRIEGYSNFLWVLWIALGLEIGVEPVFWSQLGSLGSFLVAIYAIWRLSALLFDALVPRVAAVGLFVTNYTVSAYATGGLETMLQTALLCVAVWQFYEVRASGTVDRLRVLAASLALAAAVLTRMDSLLPSAIIGLWGLVHLVRRRHTLKGILLGVTPFAVIIGSWLAWKLAYYGRLLPNAFYVKVDWAPSAFSTGCLYLGRFLHWYLIWPFLVIGVLSLIVPRGRRRWDLLPLGIIILAWCVYIVFIGGDFMEFRFVVPIAPFVFVMLAYLVFYGYAGRWFRRPLAATVLSCAVLLAASYRHAKTFRGMTADSTLDSIHLLSSFYNVYRDGDWSRIGTTLGEQVGGTDVVIASQAVGAIPYYSGVTTVDMFGLNDPYIPIHGRREGPDYRRPGHRVYTTLSYLRQRRVNLVIAHPLLFPRGMVGDPASAELCREIVFASLTLEPDPGAEATIVAMPIDREQALAMWYLTRHPHIDRLVESGQWESARVIVP